MTIQEIDDALSKAERVEFRVFALDGAEELSVVLRGKHIDEMRRYIASFGVTPPPLKEPT